VSDVLLRPATAGDVEAVAALHTQSWRDHYRGVYSDAFLDGEAPKDRLEVWGRRLCAPDSSCFTIVAEQDGVLVGFAHVILREHAKLQNIHVRSDVQRQGVGSRLVAELLQRVHRLHVWVREDNGAARAFYEARGGTIVGRDLGGPFADGSRAPVLCFAWPGDH
jgi:ribosomal protein S18 acetylase RimI-like enzyme